MKIRKWKAFMRLSGETLVDSDADILNEFKGFVLALKRVGIEYSLVVNVDKTEISKDLDGAGPVPMTAREMLPTDKARQIGE